VGVREDETYLARHQRRLKELSEARGFAVVVLAHPEAFAYVGDETRRLGFVRVETHDAVRAWAGEHGMQRVDQPPQTITGGDPHPSPIGYEIIASVLADALQSSGLAARRAAKRASAASSPPP
jgi:hypothetical protein